MSSDIIELFKPCCLHARQLYLMFLQGLRYIVGAFYPKYSFVFVRNHFQWHLCPDRLDIFQTLSNLIK